MLPTSISFLKKQTSAHKSYVFACLFLVSLFISPMHAQRFPLPSSNSNRIVGPLSENDSLPKFNPVNGYDLEKLRQRGEAAYKRQQQERNAARSYAQANNLPIRYTLPDGGVAEIRRIAPDGSPTYYRTFNEDAAISTRTNFLYSGGGLGLDLGGMGMTAHVWDGGHARVSHQEYDGAGGSNRVTIEDIPDEGLNLHYHAAHVTGTVCASGVQPAAKGMAWESQVRGFMWNDDVGEASIETTDMTINDSNGMLISNHSYGFIATSIPDAWFGQYGSDAVAWDGLMHDAPYYLMVVAAGNDGNNNTANGNPLNGETLFDKLSGHATAKNNLVVANGYDAIINGDGTLNSVSRNPGSSEGPTDDLRIKPDIMGNGTTLYSTYESTDTDYNIISGTSMASPNVAGTLLVLQEHYRDVHGSFMRAATLKGLALHTADDAGPLVGPDAEVGWGLLNAKKAAETITQGALLTGSAIVEELTLLPGQTYQITVESDGVNPLQASISWTDPAHALISGTNNTTKALVNDLDMTLDNGTTYYPWRLTDVDVNSNAGDNNSDPFERVDVSGASGSYTLTVTHDGSLQNGDPQDFTLIVTGIVKTAGPVISFENTYDTQVEGSECSFFDVVVPVALDLPASQDADISFSTNGASTATEGVDFTIITSNLQFASGSSGTQNFIVRIFEDVFVEGDEDLIIDMSVNANGGDAFADPNANSLTVEINDDDATPGATYSEQLFYEDFEDVTGWSTINNGDGPNWGFPNNEGVWGYEGVIARSFSWNGVPYTPDNYLISPSVALPGNAQSISVSYLVGSATDPDFFSEHYSFYFTTDASNETTITNGVVLVDDYELPAVGTDTRVHDVTGSAGDTGYFVMRHWNCYDEWYLGYDNLLVEAILISQVQTAINTGSPDMFQLKGTGTAHAIDPSSDNRMIDITNNDGFDYGCTEVSVSRSGTGAQGYDGSALPNHVTNKTFTIVTENATNSGNNTLTFYFEEAEVAGWEAATGLSRNDLVVARGSASNEVETSSVTIGAFNSDVTFTGNFNGLDGTFYFGPAPAFSNCNGVAKTWNGSAWSPAAPTSIDAVVINGNYNTDTHGAIDACNLNINGGFTLTVTNTAPVEVQGNIVVDGSLIIEHQANLVQYDDQALTINNGTIHVEVTSPVLETRDFMIMGSPMSGETRNGVYNSAFLVLDFHPENFLPHPDVPPGGTNFADDNGDHYTIYGSGPIHPGEGYIVRPQSSYTDPAGVPYDFLYQQGTLNNGEITYTNYNNGATANPNGTPNVVANPYPSAIDADAFMAENGITELYFWEHLTPPGVPLSGSNLRFDMDDISLYNETMGVPAANDPGTSTTPNGVIATSQGFGIRTTGAPATTGTILFNNAMRLTSGNTTLRNSNTQVEKVILELREINYGYGSYTGIGFRSDATNLWDDGMDSNRLATVVSLFSKFDDGSEQLGIQTLPEFESDVKVPVGFESQIDEELKYEISIAQLEGENLEEATLYLIDNNTNTIHNLSEENYHFISKKGFYPKRFTLLFEYGWSLGTNGLNPESIAVYPNPTDDVMTIASPEAEILAIRVYDIQGRMIQESYPRQQIAQINLATLDAAIYFVEIHTDAGDVTKRVIKK